MSDPYIGRTGETRGMPLPGLTNTSPDNLPTIEDYGDVADLPLVYNELANAVQAGLTSRLTQASPSSPSATPGFRRVFVSANAPTASDGADGDVWFQTET